MMVLGRHPSSRARCGVSGQPAEALPGASHGAGRAAQRLRHRLRVRNRCGDVAAASIALLHDSTTRKVKWSRTSICNDLLQPAAHPVPDDCLPYHQRYQLSALAAAPMMHCYGMQSDASTQWGTAYRCAVCTGLHASLSELATFTSFADQDVWWRAQV